MPDEPPAVPADEAGPQHGGAGEDRGVPQHGDAGEHGAVPQHEAWDRAGTRVLRTAHDLGAALAEEGAAPDPVVVRTGGPHRSIDALAALIDAALADDDATRTGEDADDAAARTGDDGGPPEPGRPRS
jgi:hypothetical protein